MNDELPKNPKDSDSAKELAKMNMRNRRFPDLIGLLPRYSGDDKIADTEAFVRDLVGTKLRRRTLVEPLSQRYTRFAGTTIWNKGKSDFSSTELRIVSEEEYTSISELFSKSWTKKKPHVPREVSLSTFVSKVYM